MTKPYARTKERLIQDEVKPVRLRVLKGDVPSALISAPETVDSPVEQRGFELSVPLEREVLERSDISTR